MAPRRSRTVKNNDPRSKAGRPRLYVVARSDATGAAAGAQATPGAPALSVDAVVGREFKRLREVRGLSLKKLSAELGVSARAVKSFESGEIRFPAQVLLRATHILGVQPSALFEVVAEIFSRDELSRDPGARVGLPTMGQGTFQKAQLSYIAEICESLVSAVARWPVRDDD